MSLGAVFVIVILLILAAWMAQRFMPEPFTTPTLVVVVLVAVAFILSVAFPGLFGMRISR